MQVPQSRPNLGPLEAAAVQEVMASGILSLGPRVKLFEQAFRDRLGIAHACAVSSGTAGLHLCVRALGLKEGDEVLTSPFSFVASANCLEFEGVIPRFVDIDPVTANIDVNRLASAVTPRTRGILPVHVFGQTVDMDAVGAVARESGLVVIEDACEALGAAWNGRPAGTLGDAAVFAFYPNKQITTGEGGMVVTASDEAFSLMDSMRNQGRADDGGWLRHERLGYNYRLDELSAAVGEVQMRRLDELLAARARVAALYERHLASLDGLELPRRVPPAEVSWFVYVPRLEAGLDRDVAIRLLGERGVQCRPYFPPIHLQPYFVRKYGYREGDFPVTEALAKRTISIPFHGLMSEAEVLYVRDCLREVIGLLRGRTAA